MRAGTPLAVLAAGLFVAAAQAQDEPPSEPAADEAVPPDEAPTEQADGDPAPPLGIDTTIRLEPIVVTARFWEEPLQSIPQSVSVVDESTIRDAGIASVRDASAHVPNLHFTEFSSRRLSFPTIRGIGSALGDPAVTTYVNGVPQLTVSSTNIALLDVERIEFLRGPQGTLYGRNSIGGLIHLQTKRPPSAWTVEPTVTFGNYSIFDAGVSAGGPIIEEKLFVNLSGLRSSRDGFTTNDFTGNDVDHRKSVFGRGQLLWTPNDQNEVRLTLYGERSRDGGFVLSELEGLRDRPHRISQDFEGEAERDIASTSATWDHFGESVEITAISAYQDWDIRETSDFDFSVIDGVRRTTTESQQHFNQEIRFSSSDDHPVVLSDDAHLKWLLGGQVFVADSDRTASNEFRPGGAGILFPPEQVGTDTTRGAFDDLGLAIFGQVTVTLFERLELGAGLRFDYEDKEADLRHTFETMGFVVLDESSAFDERYDDIVPRFSAGYHINDDAMAYALVAKGFKAGGFNLNAPDGEIPFDPETSWTYEAGFKTQWFDDRLTANASVFYITWDDMQLSLFDARAGGFVENAGEATSMGFELEFAAQIGQGWEAFATLGLTDAEFEEFVDPYGVDVSGNHLAFVPETTIGVGAQYTHSLGHGRRLFARGEYAHVGTYFYDAGNRESEDYGLATFRVGFASANVRVEGWIRNAFNEDYVLVAFQPSPVDPTVFVGESGAPQTFGVTLTVEF